MDENLKILTRHLIDARYADALEVLDKNPPSVENMDDFVHMVNFTCHLFGSANRPHADSPQAADLLEKLLQHVPQGHPKLIDGLIEAIDVSVSTKMLADLYLQKGAINPRNTEKQLIELAWITFQRPPHHKKQLKKYFTFPQAAFWEFVKKKGKEKHGFAQPIEKMMPQLVDDFFVERDKRDLQKSLKKNAATIKPKKCCEHWSLYG